MTVRHISRRSSGFTLIEMMVALFIFGMLASASVILLRQSVAAQAQSAERLNEMGDIRRFSALLSQDFAAIVARPSIDSLGSPRLAFAMNSSDDALMGFTRQAPVLEIDGPASTLQRVEYGFSEGVFQRAVADMSDGAQMREAAPILTDIGRIELRVRDSGGLWVSVWQPQRADDLPIAVELSLFRNEGGVGEPLVMRFLVGGAR